jgi:hypothetical protein
MLIDAETKASNNQLVALTAHLDPGLSRWVKWWLLAIPHYLVIGLLVTNWWGWTPTGSQRSRSVPSAVAVCSDCSL